MSRGTEPLSAFGWLFMNRFEAIEAMTTCMTYQQTLWQAVQMTNAYMPGSPFGEWYYGDSWRIGRPRRAPLPASRWWAVWTKEFWFPKLFDLYEVAEWVA